MHNSSILKAVCSVLQHLSSPGYKRAVPLLCAHDRIRVVYRIAGNFRKHKFSRITTKHGRKKKFAIFIFATRPCLATPPTIFRKELVTHSVYFQHRNDSKISTLLKACWSLTAKTAMQKKGRGGSPFSGQYHFTVILMYYIILTQKGRGYSHALWF